MSSLISWPYACIITTTNQDAASSAQIHTPRVCGVPLAPVPYLGHGQACLTVQARIFGDRCGVTRVHQRAKVHPLGIGMGTNNCKHMMSVSCRDFCSYWPPVADAIDRGDTWTARSAVRQSALIALRVLTRPLTFLPLIWSKFFPRSSLREHREIFLNNKRKMNKKILKKNIDISTQRNEKNVNRSHAAATVHA